MIKCFFLKVDIGDLNGCIYDVFLFIIVRFKGINENLFKFIIIICVM